MTKKGLSIGAAMKQRMSAQGERGKKEPEILPLQIASVEVVAPEERQPGEGDLALPPQTLKRPEPEAGNDPLESFNTRLPRSLQRRLKVHVALQGTKIQDVLNEALDDYLTRHGG